MSASGTTIDQWKVQQCQIACRIGAILLALLSVWAILTGLSAMNIRVVSGTVDAQFADIRAGRSSIDVTHDQCGRSARL